MNNMETPSIATEYIIPIIAKALSTQGSKTSSPRHSIGQLEQLLCVDLPEALNAAGHPDTPAISADCSNFVDALQNAFLFQDFLKQPIIWLEGEETNETLAYLGKNIAKNMPQFLTSLSNKLPFVVMHGDALKLELVNYANVRIELNVNTQRLTNSASSVKYELTEYEMLLEGCRQTGIALEKIIKFFVLFVPLKTSKNTYLLAGKEAENSNLLRYVSRRYYVVKDDEMDLGALSEKRLDGILYAQKSKSLQGVPFLSPAEFVQEVSKAIPFPLFGFSEEYERIAGRITSFFATNIKKSEKMIADITDDMICQENDQSARTKIAIQESGNVSQNNFLDWTVKKKGDYTTRIAENYPLLEEKISKIFEKCDDNIEALKKLPQKIREQAAFKDFISQIERELENIQRENEDVNSSFEVYLVKQRDLRDSGRKPKSGNYEQMDVYGKLVDLDQAFTRFNSLLSRAESFLGKSSIGNGKNDLSSLREQERQHIESLERHHKELKLLLSRIDENLQDFVDALDLGLTSGRLLPRWIVDEVFKNIFNAVKANEVDILKKAKAHLKTIGYDGCDLLAKYLAHSTISRSDLEERCAKLQKSEWEKAKMLLALVDMEKVSEVTLEKLLDCASGYLDTGKEIFARAIYSKDSENTISLLIASYQKGYIQAGKLLVEKYGAADNRDIRNILAQMLHPDACIALGEEIYRNMEKEKMIGPGKNYITIEHPCLTYYKLAASQDSDEAMARIADIIFQNSFLPVCFLEKRSSSVDVLARNAQVVCWLANELVGKGFQVNHFKEVLGITLFSLKQDREAVKARQLLQSLKDRSPEANYCLGYMSEKGLGCAKNLNGAMRYYANAIKAGPLTANGELVSKRLNNVKKAWHKNMERRKEDYDEDNDYSGDYSTSSSGGGTTMIFILACGIGYFSRQLLEMRSFRDAHICNTTFGQQVVDEYYRIAPQVRKSISNSEDSLSVCQEYWEKHLKYVQQSLDDCNWNAAKQRLLDMQIEICTRYKIPYDTELVEKYKKQEHLS